MSKNSVTNEFDYFLSNSQIIRRFNRINFVQFLILIVILTTVFYIGRYSNSCKFNYVKGATHDIYLPKGSNILTVTENELENKTTANPSEDYVRILR